MFLYTICHVFAAHQNPLTQDNSPETERLVLFLKTMHYKSFGSETIRMIENKTKLDNSFRIFAKRMYGILIRDVELCASVYRSLDNSENEFTNRLSFDFNRLHVALKYLYNEFNTRLENQISLICFDEIVYKYPQHLQEKIRHEYSTFIYNFKMYTSKFIRLFLQVCMDNYVEYKSQINILTKNEFLLKACFVMNQSIYLDWIEPNIEYHFSGIRALFYKYRRTNTNRTSKIICDSVVFWKLRKILCVKLFICLHLDTLEVDLDCLTKTQNLPGKTNQIASIDMLNTHGLMKEGQNIYMAPYIPQSLKPILSAFTNVIETKVKQKYDIIFEVDFKYYFYTNICWISTFRDYTEYKHDYSLDSFRNLIKTIFAFAENQSFKSMHRFFLLTKEPEFDLKICLLLNDNAYEKDFENYLFSESNFRRFFESNRVLLAKLKCIFEDYFIFCMYKQAKVYKIECFLYLKDVSEHSVFVLNAGKMKMNDDNCNELSICIITKLNKCLGCFTKEIFESCNK